MLPDGIDVAPTLKFSQEPERVPEQLGLCMHLSLWNRKYGAERRRILQLGLATLPDGKPFLSRVSRLYVIVPSAGEAPGALGHSLIQLLARVVGETSDTAIVWCRQLWQAWPGLVVEGPQQQTHDPKRAEVYAAAIERVRAEADAAGYAGCGLDAEPYGANPAKEWLKKRDLTRLEQSNVLGAVRDAVGVTGPVDWVYPVGGKRTGRYGWCFVDMGRDGMSSNLTFRSATGAGVSLPQSPLDEPFRFTDWGVWVGAPGSKGTPVRLSDVLTAPPADTLTLGECEAERRTIYVTEADWGRVFRSR
jgi:hypothetical protein